MNTKHTDLAFLMLMVPVANRFLSLGAQPVDAELDDVSRSDKLWGPATQSYSGRRARRNYITRQQCHVTAQIANQVRNAEDEIARIAILPDGAVHFQPKPQLARLR